MLVDREKILRFATLDPTEPPTVLVLKQNKSCCPDGVYDLCNENHAIHVGISVESDIVFYGVIKTLSKKYGRIPGDPYDRWPSITIEEFEEATSAWVRRSGYIGDRLESTLELLKNLGYLNIHQYNGVISMAFTREAVSLILKTVGLSTDIKYIFY